MLLGGVALGAALSEHEADSVVHITAAERDDWNNKDYNELENKPNLLDDESDSFNITDEAGNIAFKVDGTGAHSVEFTANGVALGAALSEHEADSVAHVTAEERANWSTKDYNELENVPHLVDDGSGEFVIADPDGNMAFKVDANGTYVTHISVGGADFETTVANLETALAEKADAAAVTAKTNSLQSQIDTLTTTVDTKANEADLQSNVEALTNSIAATDAIADEALALAKTKSDLGHTHTLTEVTDWASAREDIDSNIEGVDTALATHKADTIVHITAAEREDWNNKDYNELTNRPNILDDASDEFNVVDSSNNVIFKVAEGGAYVTHVSVNGADFETTVANMEETLAGKSDVGHGHAISAITNLQTTLNGKSNTGHSHTSSEITDLQQKLDEIDAAIEAAANAYTLPVATSSKLGGVKSGTDITVDSSGNVSVNDDSHNHTIANVDNLQTTLDSMDAALADVENQIDEIRLGKVYTYTYTGEQYNEDVVMNRIGDAPAGLRHLFGGEVSVTRGGVTKTATIYPGIFAYDGSDIPDGADGVFLCNLLDGKMYNPYLRDAEICPDGEGLGCVNMIARTDTWPAGIYVEFSDGTDTTRVNSLTYYTTGVDDHIGDIDAHITANERDTWNSQLDTFGKYNQHWWSVQDKGICTYGTEQSAITTDVKLYDVNLVTAGKIIYYSDSIEANPYTEAVQLVRPQQLSLTRADSINSIAALSPAYITGASLGNNIYYLPSGTTYSTTVDDKTNTLYRKNRSGYTDDDIYLSCTSGVVAEEVSLTKACTDGDLGYEVIESRKLGVYKLYNSNGNDISQDVSLYMMQTEFNATTSNANTIYYSDSIDINQRTGEITLVNPKSVVFASAYTKSGANAESMLLLRGKYITGVYCPYDDTTRKAIFQSIFYIGENATYDEGWHSDDDSTNYWAYFKDISSGGEFYTVKAAIQGKAVTTSYLQATERNAYPDLSYTLKVSHDLSSSHRRIGECAAGSTITIYYSQSCTIVDGNLTLVDALTKTVTATSRPEYVDIELGPGSNYFYTNFNNQIYHTSSYLHMIAPGSQTLVYCYDCYPCKAAKIFNTSNDGMVYRYLGVPFDKAAVAPQIEYGSYVGTGLLGYDNPNSLTFNFAPHVVIFLGMYTSDIVQYQNVNMDMLNTVYSSGGPGWAISSSAVVSYAKKSDDGKTLFWYVEGTSAAASQFNMAGITYHYMAIG